MLSKEETLNLAREYASKGYLCSETCLIALSKALGYESPLIPRIATGFGAGCGRKQELCGAISGAVMGLSIKFGRDKIETAKDWRPYWFATKLMEGFKEKYGMVRCLDLLGLDLNKPEEYTEFGERGYWEKKCTNFILNATELAYDIMNTKG